VLHPAPIAGSRRAGVGGRERQSTSLGVGDPAKTLAKWGERCVVCGSTDRVEAHHVHGLAQGGSHEGEGVPLCGGTIGAVERGSGPSRLG